MPTLPDIHLHCELMIGGAVAEEHGVVYTDTKQAACFVEAASGKSFTLKVRALSDLLAPRLQAKVYIDGIERASELSNSRNSNPLQLHTVELGGTIEEGGRNRVDGSRIGYLRKWRFKELATSDEGDVVTAEALSKIGTIEVVVWRWRPATRAEQRMWDRQNEYRHEHHHHHRRRHHHHRERYAGPLPETVNEKSVKGSAISHVVAVGGRSLSSCIRSITGVSLDTESTPYARFTFRYASRTRLECLGVLPAATAATSLPTATAAAASAWENMSREELLQELRRKNADAEVPQLKTEKPVKQENEGAGARSWRFKRGEVVNLTD